MPETARKREKTFKVFHDWEFLENGESIQPISVGFVTERGDNEYFANADFNWDGATSWLKENVKPYMDKPFAPEYLPLHEFNNKIVGYFKTLNNLYPDSKIELVGYMCDYDHVALAQRYGVMAWFPSYMPYYTSNVRQWADDLGLGDIPIPSDNHHNAVADAIWTKRAYDYLVKNYHHPAWSALQYA